MDSVLFVARVLLVGIFGLSGVAKLAARAGSRQALMDLGVFPALATPLGLLLPLAELAVAVALVPATTAWGGAFGALALLLVFLAGLSLALAQGRIPTYHRVSQLSSARIRWQILIRTGAFAAVAGLIVWQAPRTVGPSAVCWLGELTPVQLGGVGASVVTLGLLATQGWFLCHLMRQHGRLLLRLDAQELGLAIHGLAQGHLASPVVVGVTAILALAAGVWRTFPE